MAGGDKAQKLKVQAKVGGKSKYVTRIHAEIAVNTFWPKVTLETHQKKEAHSSALELGSGETAKEIGGQQKKIFQSRNSEDCTVSISGGDAGSFSFKGFTIGSTYAVSAQSVSLADAAIVGYSKVSSLNYGVGRRIEYKDEQIEPELKPGDSFAKFILGCVQQLDKDVKEAAEGGGKTIDAAERKLQSKLNDKVANEFKKLLQASVKTMGWKEAAQLIASGKCGSDATLRSRVYGILAGGASGSFETTIQQLAEEFQCIYVPEWKQIGKLVNRGELMKEKKSLSITIVSMSLNTANGGSLFPIKFAAISPPQHPEVFEIPKNYFIATPQANVQPGASMIRSEGPLWISPSAVMEEIEKSGTQWPEERRKKQKASKAKQAVKKKKKKKEKSGNSLKKILLEYGKCLYVFQSLAGSYATIVTPINFKPELGKCYKVKSAGSGQEILTGILWQIDHDLSTGGGQSPNAYTTLTFRIVQMSGFTLPGAD